jgi:hypothetical protein
MINHINYFVGKLNKIMQILVSSLYYPYFCKLKERCLYYVNYTKDGENIDRALKRYKENLIKQELFVN